MSLVMGALVVLMVAATLWGFYVFRKIERDYTQDCPICGEVALRARSPEKWKCDECGAIEFTDDLLERKDIGQ